MRRTLTWLVLIAAILGGVVILAERLVVAELRRLAARDEAFSAAAITPAPGFLRIGARLTNIRAALPRGSVGLETAELWVTPLSPFTARIALAPNAILDLPEGRREITYSQPRVIARFGPLAGFAPDHADLAFSDIRLDGQPFAKSAVLGARAVAPQPDAPKDSRAGYDVDWTLEGLDAASVPLLSPLAEAAGPDADVAFTGKGRFWLDAVPTPGAMAALPSPMLTGLRIDAAELRVGPVGARILGRLDADEQGRALGALAIYTADAGPMLEGAAASGMIPRPAVTLAQAMMRRLSAMPVAAGNAPGEIDFPDAPKGELRLPLTFAGGRMSLGPIPLGAAPQLRP